MKKQIIKAIDNKILSCKKCWIVGFKNYSVEVMAISSSIIENLIELKYDCGLITKSQYLSECYDFAIFKECVKNDCII